MSGSLREFRYLSDTGLTFNIVGDESNIEEVNAALTSAELNPVVGQLILPVATRCRSARYTSLDRRVSRVVPILSPSVVTSLPAQITVSSGTGAAAGTQVVLVLARTYPEKFRRAIGADSGLNDGD